MDDDAAQLRERIDKLEQIAAKQQETIDDQQETIDELENQSLLGQWGRRGVLGSIAAALGIASASGSAAAGVGDVGTPSERVDIFGDQADVNALEVDGVNRGNNNERLDASTFNGSDADTRLDNALSAASSGQTIYLEQATYDAIHTIDKRLTLIGTNQDGNGTRIESTVNFTVNSICLSQVQFVGTLNVDAFNCVFKDSFTLNSTITVSSGAFRMYGCRGGDVTFESGTSGGIVDASSAVTVTDNGTNTVGDIA